MVESSSAARAGTFRSAWSHRRWRWLLTSFAVSLTGSFLYSVALVVFLIERTGSAGWVSAAIIARLVPYAVLSAPAGVLADRRDRRVLMMQMDLARVVLLAAMAVVAWWDGPALAVVVLAVLASAAGTPHRPAAVAATPLLVTEDDLAAANAAESVIAQAAWFVGPAIGAGVVALWDPGTAFALNAIAFAVSAALVSRIGDVGGRSTPVTALEADADGDLSVAASFVEGVRAVRRDAGLLALLVLVCVLLFSFGMEQVLHVLVAVERLELGAEGVGLMGAAIGAGGLAVAPFTARIGRSGHVGTFLVLSGVGVGLPLIALSLTDSVAVAMAVLAVEGAATIVNEVLLITLLQRACADDVLARVFGLQESATGVTQLLGSLVAPVVVTAAGLGAALWVGGGAAVAGSVLCAPAIVALAARTQKDRARLEPMVARLRRVELFSGASDAALERLAAAASSVSVNAGDVVLTEGDPPDDLYVIDTGELVATARGETGGPEVEVSRMGPDEWFGEIGLLRGVPRTATVTASTPSRLTRLPGQVYLDTFAAPDLVPDPVRRALAVRLSRTHPTVATAEPA